MDAATDLAETSYASGGTRTSFNIGNYYASSAATELTGHMGTLLPGYPQMQYAVKEYRQRTQSYGRLGRSTRYLCETIQGGSSFPPRLFLLGNVSRYGPVPLVTDVLDPDGDLLSNYTTRPSLKEYVVDFILKELKDCEEAIDG